MDVRVLIVLGNHDDVNKFADCFALLDEFSVKYKICIGSPYFNQDNLYSYIQTEVENDIDIIISGSSDNSYLPGAVASVCSIPVIGVPIKEKNESSIKALLPIIEMPKGVPIASVGINCIANAAILGLEILAVSDKDLKIKLKEYKKYLSLRVEEKDENLQKIL